MNVVRAGRPSSKTSHKAIIPNVGQAGSKSSDKFTLLTIVNANYELLPFLTIVPSKAKEGNRKINPGMLMGYQQLKGKYGCFTPQTHSCTFASTEKGYVLFYFIVTCAVSFFCFDRQYYDTNFLFFFSFYSIICIQYR